MTLLLLDRVAVDPESPQTRVVDAALECIARWGLTKTTIDDIAREAGMGRATLYRLFPGGRDAVIDAVVTTETTRFFGRLDGALAPATSLEDVLAITIAEAGRTLAGHAALQFLVAHEPEVILPHVAFQQMDAVLRVVAATVGPYLAPWVPGDPETAERGAEWMARLVFSYLLAPSPDVNFADTDSIRRLVRTYVLPGFQPAAV